MAEDWHALNKTEVFKKLSGSEEGISERDAKLRLKRYGNNQIRKMRHTMPLFIFLKQFDSLLIYILLATAITSFLMNNLIDSAVIFAIIILNSVLGFAQEYKAEKAIERLKEMLVPYAKVLRDKEIVRINASEIVPGDILIFNEGDKIMADARLLSITDLEVNEAVLTGESLPKDKCTSVLPIDTVLANRMNMIYTGTTIARGSGKAVVISTGMSTEFGRIAGLIQKVETHKTPLQIKFDSFTKKLSIFIIITCILLTLIGIASGFDKMKMFMIGVSLAISAIPEGLPAVIAITLALSVQKMSRENSLIRQLPAAETLGRTTIIVTDKTGTITEEKMSVREIYYDNKILTIDENRTKILREKTKESKELGLILKTGILCNNVRTEVIKDGKEKEIVLGGDPTEKALVIAAENAGLIREELENEERHLKEFSFSSSRKMMSVVKEVEEKGEIKKISYVKGSPEVILKRCSKEMINGKTISLTKERTEILAKIYENMASRALRVLGFAYREVRMESQSMAENDLIFLGFQGMLDPPRREVKDALKKCNEAGIRVIMVTGDSVLTARAISTEIGLEGDILSDIELEKLSDVELEDALKKTAIFARISPKNKLRIVEILKKSGEIVAVTGDGVNDVLALKKADIGIAMGIRGTDVARETSDIVLLDDNFSSIVNAIHEGRRSYVNIKKSLKFLLAVNFSEIGLILFSILMRLPLPLLPLQILWMNLITDSFPALALGVEPAEKDIMQKKPRNTKEGIIARMIPFIIAGGILALMTEAIAFMMCYSNGTEIEKTRTMVLTTAILFEMFFVFSCKSKKSILKTNIFNNKWLLYSISLVILLQILAIYSPLNNVFGIVPLTLNDWMAAAGVGMTGFIAIEIYKIIAEKTKEKPPKKLGSF